jgi:predicted PurR-regulated permease PerM
VAVLLPLLIATVTKSGFSTQVAIIICYLVIQFIDNHFLVPYIVSSKVKINALISIVVVLMGGLLWGIAGMFLSIPFVGILKIVFDRVPELKPWGRLLGDDVPTRHKGEIWTLRSSRRKRSQSKPS